MKLHTKLMLGLISSPFAVSLATVGTKMGPHHSGMGCDGMGKRGASPIR